MDSHVDDLTSAIELLGPALRSALRHAVKGHGALKVVAALTKLNSKAESCSGGGVPSPSTCVSLFKTVEKQRLTSTCLKLAIEVLPAALHHGQPDPLAQAVVEGALGLFLFIHDIALACDDPTVKAFLAIELFPWREEGPEPAVLHLCKSLIAHLEGREAGALPMPNTMMHNMRSALAVLLLCRAVKVFTPEPGPTDLVSPRCVQLMQQLKVVARQLGKLTDRCRDACPDLEPCLLSSSFHAALYARDQWEGFRFPSGSQAARAASPLQNHPQELAELRSSLASPALAQFAWDGLAAALHQVTLLAGLGPGPAAGQASQGSLPSVRSHVPCYHAGRWRQQQEQHGALAWAWPEQPNDAAIAWKQLQGLLLSLYLLEPRQQLTHLLGPVRSTSSTSCSNQQPCQNSSSGAHVSIQLNQDFKSAAAAAPSDVAVSSAAGAGAGTGRQQQQQQHPLPLAQTWLPLGSCFPAGLGPPGRSSRCSTAAGHQVAAAPGVPAPGLEELQLVLEWLLLLHACRMHGELLESSNLDGCSARELLMLLTVLLQQVAPNVRQQLVQQQGGLLMQVLHDWLADRSTEEGLGCFPRGRAVRSWAVHCPSYVAAAPDGLGLVLEGGLEPERVLCSEQAVLCLLQSLLLVLAPGAKLDYGEAGQRWLATESAAYRQLVPMVPHTLMRLRPALDLQTDPTTFVLLEMIMRGCPDSSDTWLAALHLLVVLSDCSRCRAVATCPTWSASLPLLGAVATASKAIRALHFCPPDLSAVVGLLLLLAANMFKLAEAGASAGEGAVTEELQQQQGGGQQQPGEGQRGVLHALMCLGLSCVKAHRYVSAILTELALLRNAGQQAWWQAWVERGNPTPGLDSLGPPEASGLSRSVWEEFWAPLPAEGQLKGSRQAAAAPAGPPPAADGQKSAAEQATEGGRPRGSAAAAPGRRATEGDDEGGGSPDISSLAVQLMAHVRGLLLNHGLHQLIVFLTLIGRGDPGPHPWWSEGLGRAMHQAWMAELGGWSGMGVHCFAAPTLALPGALRAVGPLLPSQEAQRVAKVLASAGGSTSSYTQGMLLGTAEAMRTWRYACCCCSNPSCRFLMGPSELGALMGQGGSAGGMCGRCRSVWFCSRECQRKAWSGHKQDCRPRQQI